MSTGAAPDPAGHKLGPFWFVPGYSWANIGTVNIYAFCTMAAITFMSFAQPVILTDILQIPEERQGRVTGNIAAIAEVFSLILVGFFGAWSDKVGRRTVFAIGFGLVAISYFLYPLASSEGELLIYRLIFATGSAVGAVMLSAAIQDSVQEGSRGKWVAINSIFTGFGVLLMSLVFARLPDILVGMGYAPAAAARYAFWTVSGFTASAAVVIWLGLKKGVTAQDPDRGSLLSKMQTGFRIAVENPRIAVAYGAAFIGRGDLIIVSTFLSLWVVQYGTQNGFDTAESLKRAGMMFGVIQGAALLWSYFIGLIADRINRLLALGLGLAIAAVGYGGMGLVDDPFARQAIWIGIILGMGEISVLIAAGVLIGQDAPIRLRGTILGLFSIMGSAGITFATLAGGYVFDKIAPNAPFLMMGILNGALCLSAIWVKLREGKQPTQPVDQAL